MPGAPIYAVHLQIFLITKSFGASLDFICVGLDSCFSFNIAVSRKRNKLKAKNGVAMVSSILYSDSTSTLVSCYQCLLTLKCPFEWKPGAHAPP